MRKWLILLLIPAILLTGCPAKTKKPFERGPLGAREQEPTGKEPTITLLDEKTGQKKEIKMEEYLQGVVAGEMEVNWPVEALAAQAIIARTFTMNRIKTKGGVPGKGADASTNEKEFQAYAPERINDNVRKAVAMTRGEVVRYKGQYAKAFFSADNGGVTAAPDEGLGTPKEKAVYLKPGIKDRGNTIAPPENKSWTARFPMDKVTSAVTQITGQSVGQVTAGNVKILKKGPSGRAVTVQIGKAKVSAPALRLALGNDIMRSTLIDKFALQGGQLVIHGKGFGHGVGLSQWGANYMAKKGSKPEDIIRKYYIGVTVDKMWK